MIVAKNPGKSVWDGRRWVRPVLRAVSCLTAVLLLVAVRPDWGRVGRAAALVSAGLQQPDGAAALLAGRLEDAAAPERTETSESTAVTGEAVAAYAPPAGQDTGDTTAPVVTAQVTEGKALSVVADITPPGKNGSGGKIVRQQLGTGDTPKSGITTRNKSGTSVDIAAAMNAPLPVQFTDTDEPQVLIVHTHTTEGFMLYDAGYYNAADRKRTRDESRNVCRVGEAIIEALAQEGIAAVHDTAIHDDPQYTGAYDRSAETVQKNLKKYPSIRLVLDIHRDSIMSDDTTVVKPTATVNGRNAAQMMIICSVVSTKKLPNSHWEENLSLATKWQKLLMTEYPGLMRPLSTVASRYNQHLCAGYLLVEVGAEGNTLGEAVYSGQLLGKTVAKLLTAC